MTMTRHREMHTRGGMVLLERYFIVFAGILLNL